MIDLAAIEDALYQVWHSYLLETTGKDVQILLSDQDFDEIELLYPRIMYKIAIPYSTGNANPIKEKDVVPSDDPNFDEDIEYTHLIDRYITLFINGYGESSNPVREILLQLREWFEIEELGNRFFEDYNGIIVPGQIGDVQDRTTILSNEHEQRFGFDVEISFEDKVKVREKTIETVEINNEEVNK